jgi:DNA polymerase-3 subunit delta
MAKLRPEQLSGALQKQLAPVYLICGDEPLLIQETCDLIRSAARQQGFSERIIYNVDKSFEWHQLLTEANSLSLFSDKKILELRIDNGKPGDAGSKAFVEYCENINSDNILLVITPKLDGNTQRGKWYKTLEKSGAVVQIWPVNEQQLPQWLDTRLRSSGLNADRETIALLAAQVEGNLLAATQEIEKLKLLAIDGQVTTDMIAGMVSDSARYDVFGLIDKALSGDTRSAVKCLHGLRSDGTDAITILWALAREIRTLLHISHTVSQGKNFDWAAKKAGVWDNRKNLIQNALRRHSSTQLQLLLRKSNAIDKAIKGARNADAWDELLDVTLNLCGIYSLQPKIQKLSLTIT